jgi:hypothetical protein
LKDEKTYLHQKQACSSSTDIEQITTTKKSDEEEAHPPL